jgi:glycosyltransferase involved in cell wall biosynthesis
MTVRQSSLPSSSISNAKSLDRVLVIGPVLPYRGGIAQHTTMLHRALRKKSECLTISFTRQYPRWLFPGESDKDEALAGHIEDGVEFLIDSINPVSWYKALKRVKEFAPSLVVFPWWHVYWAPCFGWLSSRLQKSDVEVVFLCHNVIEHESAKWKRILTGFVLSKGSRFVVHTSIDKKHLLDYFPQALIGMHPHPVNDQLPTSLHYLPRRAKLELLFYGFVRPYKGLDVLLRAMNIIKSEDVILSVVGEFWDGLDEAKSYIAKNGLSKKIEIINSYVSDEETASYFSRCDVVVLPYKSATGSGVIPLAYHYGKPVIATRVGSLQDVVEDGLTGLMIDPDSSIQLAEAIIKALSGKNFYSNKAILNFKNKLTWSGLANVVLGN